MSFFYGPPFVVPTSLATTADYTAWTKTPAPANAEAILRGCTSLVLEAAQGNIYIVDATTGVATDPLVRTALMEAVCIQAAAWVALNIDPTTGGVQQSSKAVKSKRLASGAIEYSDAEVQSTVKARAAAYTSLVPEAVRHLQQRNLLGVNPVPYG
ncbi:hypothetical protein [uncultured Microbacterium sp.]|uniref:hypothetical protein n=1 Tax=uncultured Microbacterium sp. TaxID=191216 RepID=UPI0025F582A6|nr:hypothetical protein [uncultured Microbacterium sp.]